MAPPRFTAPLHQRLNFRFRSRRGALIVALLIGWLVTPAMAQAPLRLPAIFSDHLVLQREKPIPVWGSGEPEATVTVELLTHKVETRIDDEGKWQIALPPLPAGGPHALTVSTPGDTLRLQDVYLGEVWLCAGQSNMEWPLAQSTTAEETIADANQPLIRLYHLKKKHDTYSSPYTEEEMEQFGAGNFFERGRWEVSSPATAAPFSAVAYFFGRELYDSLQVPIGLIQVAVGGSPAQSWIGAEALAAHPQLAHLVDEDSSWLESRIIHPWLAERARQNWAGREETGEKLPGHPFAPTYLYGSAIEPLAPYGIRGAIWYQGESNGTHPASYPALQNTLIESWRARFGQGDFPFYFVQLPRISDRSRWPEFRAAQAESLQLPNTGMVVTIDQGHPTDVHPRQKQVIGERLADMALAETYDRNIPSTSPTLRSYKWQPTKHTITVTLDSAISGVPDRALFTLRGYTQQGQQETVITPASISINENTIVLTYPEDFQPVTVKYAWLPYPKNIIKNYTGLPLAPFKIELPGTN